MSPKSWREQIDDRLATLSDQQVLNLLGKADGAAERVILESLRVDKLTKGLDPTTAMMAIVIDKWQKKRTPPKNK